MASTTQDGTRTAPKSRARKETAHAAGGAPQNASVGETKSGLSGGTAAVLGVAAVGVVAGLAANLGRKAAVQAPSADSSRS